MVVKSMGATRSTTGNEAATEAVVFPPPLTAPEPAILNPEGAFPCIVAVDHASNAVPPELGDLGLSADRLASHHAFDRGVAALARALAERIDAPTILCGTSRLVIDCNRWLNDPRSVLAATDGEAIPGNVDLGEAARRARIDGVFWPYHERLGALIAAGRNRPRAPMMLALHSFTRHFGGARRP